LRGGSWGNLPSPLRSANRVSVTPTFTWNYHGFRVLLCISSR